MVAAQNRRQKSNTKKDACIQGNRALFDAKSYYEKYFNFIK